MSKNFDRIFILWIDRVVWLILMVVFSNLAVEITGYAVDSFKSNFNSSSSSASSSSQNFTNLLLQEQYDKMTAPSLLPTVNRNHFWPNRDAETIKISKVSTTTTQKPSESQQNYHKQTILIHKANSGSGVNAPISSQTIFGVLPSSANDDNEGDSERMTLWDSIFNIPISTLKAVNTLVQMIAGSIQLPGKVLQSRYQQKLQTTQGQQPHKQQQQQQQQQQEQRQEQTTIVYNQQQELNNKLTKEIGNISTLAE